MTIASAHHIPTVFECMILISQRFADLNMSSMTNTCQTNLLISKKNIQALDCLTHCTPTFTLVSLINNSGPLHSPLNKLASNTMA
ncbi:hypothetical protein P280DRAFT_464863 [Massarina eburnea CBS 473.64]|uniref:Uncharacterized protein n=1 Tax=Massarina eburnea CBS 473.64 TaxID=1395130 RepID=A0A6A6SJV2_9PLEO|nr:hypothetical protein P280DRAFT_464863 [Massarina eburnea CBS 473.64]